MDRRNFIRLVAATALARAVPTVSSADTGASEPFATSVGDADDWGLYVNDDSIYVKHGVIPGTQEFEAAQELRRSRALEETSEAEDWGIDADHPYYTDPNYGTDYSDLAAETAQPEIAA